MDKAFYLLFATGISIAGMGWLAISLPTHWQQAIGKASPLTRQRQVWLQAGGYACQALALGACLLADHPSMAVLTWPMLLAMAALCQAMLLAWRPTLLRHLLPASWC